MQEHPNFRRSFLRIATMGALGFPAFPVAFPESAERKARQPHTAPYPHEPSPTGKTSLATFWSRAGLLRTDIRPNLDGEGLAAAGIELELILKLAHAGRLPTPVTGAAVYVWHSDACGEYSVYGKNDTSYLRGIGVTGADGRVRFRSIYPGTYLGREPHIHFEVYPSLFAVDRPDACILRSRILFPKAVSGEVYKSNLVYRPSLKSFASLNFGRAAPVGIEPEKIPQIALVSGNAQKSLRASISIPIRT